MMNKAISYVLLLFCGLFCFSSIKAADNCGCKDVNHCAFLCKCDKLAKKELRHAVKRLIINDEPFARGCIKLKNIQTGFAPLNFFPQIIVRNGAGPTVFSTSTISDGNTVSFGPGQYEITLGGASTKNKMSISYSLNPPPGVPPITNKVQLHKKPHSRKFTFSTSQNTNKITFQRDAEKNGTDASAFFVLRRVGN